MWVLMLCAAMAVSAVFVAYYAKYWVKEAFEEIDRNGGPVALCIAHLMFHAVPLPKYFLFLRDWKMLMSTPERMPHVWAMWEAIRQDRINILLQRGYEREEAERRVTEALQTTLLESAEASGR